MGTWGVMSNPRRSIRTKPAKPDPFAKTTLSEMRHKMTGKRMPLEVQKAIKKLYPSVGKSKIKGVFAKGVANKTLKFRKRFYQKLGLRRPDEIKAEGVVNTVYLSVAQKRRIKLKEGRKKRRNISASQRSEELIARKDGDTALGKAKLSGGNEIGEEIASRAEGSRVSASQVTHTDKESVNRSSASVTGEESSVVKDKTPFGVVASQKKGQAGPIQKNSRKSSSAPSLRF